MNHPNYCSHSNVEVTHYIFKSRWARVVCHECGQGVKGYFDDMWIVGWAQLTVEDYEKAMVLY